jgi:hypothetical protein
MAQFLNLMLVMVAVFAKKNEALGGIEERFQRRQESISNNQVIDLQLNLFIYILPVFLAFVMRFKKGNFVCRFFCHFSRAWGKMYRL